MDGKVVSVIVPVHNEEKNIKRCIESIQNQTYTNLEIILVNDGSDDASGIICDEYSKNDLRIKVYHTQNMGVSIARNYGLKKATGLYIQFVDSDDYIAPNTTRKLISILEKQQTDLVVCSYIRLFKEFSLKLFRIEKSGIYTNDKYLCNTLKDPGHHYYGVIWNKLYKGEIIRKSQIAFREDVRLGEDFIFNLHYLKHIKQVSVIQDHLYYYNCENDNTLSRYGKTLTTCKKELEYRDIIFNEYKKTFIEVGIFEQYKNKIQQYWRMYYVRNMYYIRYEYTSWSKKDITTWKNILLSYNQIQRFIGNYSDTKVKWLIKWIHFRSIIISVIKESLSKLKR